MKTFMYKNSIILYIIDFKQLRFHRFRLPLFTSIDNGIVLSHIIEFLVIKSRRRIKSSLSSNNNAINNILNNNFGNFMSNLLPPPSPPPLQRLSPLFISIHIEPKNNNRIH